MAICAKCGAELPPRFRFCGVCGAPVALGSDQEVRKLVTVVFSDLVGSTALGEELDAELVRRVLQRYFEAIQQLIVAHGGLVEKFVGDAVMAVFGLPAAHEDDALRAVKAAAELRERLPELARESGFELVFRIGINSGEVVAGGGQTLVTGDAVNVSARLQQAAMPGEILLGAETVRLLGGLVEAELLPPLQLRGKAEPVEAFRFRALAAHRERPKSGFVGRERELALLADAFRRVSGKREPHLFTLLGPAGIGKSRLAAEFAASLNAGARIVQGRCLSYGRAITYWPLTEVLRALGEPARPALERVVSGGATSPQQLAWCVQQALEQAARKHPLVVLLEDLHWAEPALLDLLDCVSDLSRDAPILLLCLARTELLEQRPTWGGGKLNATSLLLEPLPQTDCAALLNNLERPPEIEDRPRILERAAGNPLFLEELSAFLAEGGGKGELPPRIHAVLQARLDLLPESERTLLACAALEGTTFHLGALEVLSGEEPPGELSRGLAALTQKLLIGPAHAEVEGERAFRFRHQLIRDTAYGALPKSERARLHERFADWLEGHRGKRAELEEIGAYHLEQAALAKRELGVSELSLEQRAAAALASAAERARLRTDPRAAVGLTQRALALLAEDDPRVAELEVELAWVLGPLGRLEEARQLLARAEQRITDAPVAAAIRLARLQVRLSDAPEGVPAAIRRDCSEVIPLFEKRHDHAWLARAWYLLGWAELVELQLEAMAEALTNAAAHAHRAGDRALEAVSLSIRAAFVGLARLPWPAAVEELEGLAEQFPGEPIVQSTMGVARASIAYNEGRLEQARALARESVESLRRGGYVLQAAINLVRFSWLELMVGDVEEAERLALAGIDELQQHDERGFLSGAKADLAWIRIAQGRFDDALELADEAEQGVGSSDRMAVIKANTARARAHLGLGEIERAKAAAAAAVEVAETTDSLRDQAEAQYALAEVLYGAGELPAALAAAEEAVRLSKSIGGRALLVRRATRLMERIEREIARKTVATPAA